MGRNDDAIAAYRQLVYRHGSRDWSDEKGQSIGELVKATGGNWSGSGEPGLLARYALLLSKTGRTAEALQAYQWGLDGLLFDNGKEQHPGWSAMLDLNKMTVVSFNKRRFEAACYVMLALDPGASALWITDTGEVVERDDIPIAAARKAVATRGDYAPAYLMLGNALDSKNKYSEARAAWKQALANARNGAQRKAAEERLD